MSKNSITNTQMNLPLNGDEIPVWDDYLVRKPKQPGTPTVDLLMKWNKAMMARAFSPKTIQNYMGWGDRMNVKWPALTEDVFPGCVEAASASLRKHGYSSTTIHGYQCSMASFAECVWGWEPERRKTLIMAKPAKVIHQVPSQDEVMKFLECLPGQYALIGALCYGCGLRISEVVSLQLCDVNLDSKRLNVRVSKCAKGRSVPITEELIEAMKEQAKKAMETCEKDLAAINVLAPLTEFEYHRRKSQAREPGQWPFFFQKNLVFDYFIKKYIRVFIHKSAVEKAFKDARIKAKINTRITPHRLRDAFAVHSLINGVPVNVIQNLMGHSTLETTAKYLSFLLTEEGAKLFPGINLFKKFNKSA